MALTATDLRTEVVSFTKALEPALMTGEQAAAVVRELAVIEKAAATARMFAAVRVAKTDAWRGQGHASAADWLAAHAGITVGRAAAQLRTGRQADELPKTKRAMQEGDLSPEQAEAVASASTADPAAEDGLLRAAADETAAALRRRADAARAAATDARERERRVRRERSVRYRNDAEGAFCLTLRGPAADGVMLLSLLRPFEEEAFRQSRRREREGGERETHENRTYDALMALLASPAVDAAADAPAPRTPRGGDNVKVIVRVDLAALLRGHTVAGETCEVDGVGPLSAEAVKRMLLDRNPFVAAVLHGGRQVQTVAHLGRGLSAHQRTAIEAMGLRCSNAACNKAVGMQIDHRQPWAADQRTILSNQDPLCPDCHRRKTHHGWHLEPGTGPRRFLPPDAPPRPPDRRPDFGEDRPRPEPADRPTVHQPRLC